jgi:hypothetical protein
MDNEGEPVMSSGGWRASIARVAAAEAANQKSPAEEGKLSRDKKSEITTILTMSNKRQGSGNKIWKDAAK